MTSPTRRSLVVSLGGALALGVSGARPAQAAERTVRLSFQRSSTLLTVLKLKGTLTERLGPLGFAPSWHQFTGVIEPMNAGAVDLHADVADAIPIFTQSAGARLTFYAAEDGSPRAEAIVVPDESRTRSFHVCADTARERDLSPTAQPAPRVNSDRWNLWKHVAQKIV